MNLYGTFIKTPRDSNLGISTIARLIWYLSDLTMVPLLLEETRKAVELHALRISLYINVCRYSYANRNVNAKVRIQTKYIQERLKKNKRFSTSAG